MSGARLRGLHLVVLSTPTLRLQMRIKTARKQLQYKDKAICSICRTYNVEKRAVAAVVVDEVV